MGRSRSLKRATIARRENRGGPATRRPAPAGAAPGASASPPATSALLGPRSRAASSTGPCGRFGPPGAWPAHRGHAPKRRTSCASGASRLAGAAEADAAIGGVSGVESETYREAASGGSAEQAAAANEQAREVGVIPGARPDARGVTAEGSARERAASHRRLLAPIGNELVDVSDHVVGAELADAVSALAGDLDRCGIRVAVL